MESRRDIKRRMRSIKNTQQITRAMEAVSATKMRRSQEYALNARPYTEHALKLLSNVSEQVSQKRHLLLRKKTQTNKLCLVIITSDKGLCGGYNNNMLKKTHAYIQKNDDIDIITVGKKAKKYFDFRNIPVHYEFTGFGDYIKLEQTLPFAEKIIDIYKNGQYKKIMCAYTNFISTLKQDPVIRQVLPITKMGIEEIVKGITPQSVRYASSSPVIPSEPSPSPVIPSEPSPSPVIPSEQSESRKKQTSSPYNYEYIFEPSQEIILDKLLPLLVKIQIHHMILETNASEHSARMVAMKNASDNAGEILTNLTLFYNKARQSAITNEILEVIASQEALK
ncbi:ATP synthase F1 subunit gamma [Patescibacteria group bacterium AH-259-L05]|nr:ATP synthase F1 subunit gamma [Patescibacteria group bacterium AH-259-L05]